MKDRQKSVAAASHARACTLRALEALEPEALIEAAELLLARSGKIVVTGLGKSSYVGMKIAATLTSLGEGSVFVHPVEALHGDVGVVGEGDVVIALSFSGESVETTHFVAYLKEHFHTKVIGITGKPDSSLGTLSDAVLLVQVEDEGSPLGFAPMASTTASLAQGDMLAAAVIAQRAFEPVHFARFHPGGSLGLKLKRVGEVMRSGTAVPVVSTTDPFSRVIAEVNAKKRGVTGVVDEAGRMVGIITDGDIRRFLLKDAAWHAATAAHLMTQDPKTVSERDSLEAALSLMEHHRITHLFALSEAGAPVGLILIHDIVGPTFFGVPRDATQKY